MTTAVPDARRSEPGFRHEALFYAGTADFVRQVSSFIRGGLAADEAVLAVVSAPKVDLLRAELGADAGRVCFADMADVGHNPARILPAWTDFVTEHAAPGRALRGVGEPVWPERSAAELAECEAHEALLNRAFAGTGPFWLLCPYDVSALAPSVIKGACSTHPLVRDRQGGRASRSYHDAVSERFDEPLPEPVGCVERRTFEGTTLHTVRRMVAERARRCGFDSERTEEIVLAVDEVASNSVVHGGGRGTFRVLEGDGALLFEVRDGGHIEEPLVGRRRPAPGRDRGYGLWLANQLCDLVQIRSGPAGTVVRIHLRCPDAAPSATGADEDTVGT